MDQEDMVFSLPVSFYTEFTPTLNPNILKGRARTFYKLENRNTTYFDEETAEFMISHAAGTPIVGTYIEAKNDFASHNRKNPGQTKVYGCIPNPTNFKWEKHLDEDGIEREYACFDVWLFTYHSESVLIPGKSQSMELDPKTVKGEWIKEENRQYYKFKPGVALLALCVLGEAHDPCFEGAAFYQNEKEEEQMYLSFMSFINTIMKTTFALSEENRQGGEKKTMTVKFEGVAHANYEKIFSALNSNFSEEKEYEVSNVIYSITDEEFEVFVCGEGKRKKYSYSISEEGELEYTDITLEPEDFEAKYNALSSEYEGYKTTSETSLTEKDTAYGELKSQYDTLAETTVTKETYDTTVAEKDQEIAGLSDKLAKYADKEESFELDRKKALIGSYSEDIPEKELKEFTDKLESYSYEELENGLARTHSNIVRSKKDIRIPNNMNNKSKTETLLEKYRR